ncbi:MAG TPA: insulinase family protein [Vicinamibacterales bacterium]|nr:insulinase family protein [Vicinamibacterales bacterium]
MTARTRVHALSFLVSLAAGVCLVAARPHAAPPPAQATAASQPMPVDPAIAMGKLSNGLRYYVRANPKPEKRAELRLVVKAGSILEDEDQQGLAHFVEHMAFNGMAHFPKQEIIAFIESLGMRFGADLNAYTSFDETVYMLQVPTDKPGTMDRALLILEDWAHNVTFDPVEIDKERPVIMEEWRLRRGAGARITDKLFPVLLQGSRYADRLPIGKTEVIQSFKPEALTRFYKDWYRPDLMAVVAVGDFDEAATEALVKSHFSSIPAAPSPRPRPVYDVPDHPGTIYAITTDKEITNTSVEIDNLMRSREQGSVEVYRQKTVDRLFSSLLNARFAEIAQKPDAPFMMASVGRGSFLARTKDEAALSALVKDDGIERGLEALVAEANRVAQFGFTQTEVDRQKQAILRNYERLAADKLNRVSASRADEYIRNFTQGETLPTADDEYALHQRFLPTVTLDEVNRIAKEWFTDKNRLVVVTAPDKPGVVLPDQARLTAVLTAAANKPLTAYVDTVASATLLATPPTPGSVVKTTSKDAVGITEWELSNGVKVVLKPTDFRQDEIVFRATSPGGTSLASDADYIPAATATAVVSAGGVGQLNAVDLRKMLTGKVASVTPIIGEIEEGLGGNGSRNDLETMFQLIYLRFTQPRADATAFAVQQAQIKTLLANQAASPSYAFNDALNSALYQDHPRRRAMTPAMVDQWNLDTSMAFYKDRFADASDFTFIFVGSFDLATMRPLVEKYLGGLPSTRRQETWKDVGVRMPTVTVQRTVEKGIEPKSQVQIVMNGPFEYDQTQRVAIRAMTEILSSRLLETIREDLGGTYSINAAANYQKLPRSEYTITINFGCDPKRTDDLIKRVFEEIEKFKAGGPTETQVADEREALLKDFEASTKQNSFLLNQLKVKYQYGEDPATLWDVPSYYRRLDAAAIQQAARTYLNTSAYVQVVLMPEKK